VCLRPTAALQLKPGFHSNARNARKVLHKKQYASKIKNAQETQENYASKKNKSTQAQVRQLTQAILAQENATTIESILFFTQALALRAFEWKPGFKLSAELRVSTAAKRHCAVTQ